MRKVIHLLGIVQPCDESSAVHELQPEVPSLTQPDGLGNLRRRERGAEAQMLYGVGTPLSQSGLPVMYGGFSNYNCTLSSRETTSLMMSFYFSDFGEVYRLVYGVHVMFTA